MLANVNLGENVIFNIVENAEFRTFKIRERERESTDIGPQFSTNSYNHLFL